MAVDDRTIILVFVGEVALHVVHAVGLEHVFCIRIRGIKRWTCPLIFLKYVVIELVV